MPAAPADVSAPPADAITSATGLASKVIQAGSGAEKPGPADTVTVHYTGWTTDGKQFDSSVDRGKTISFPLDGVIAGWTEGLQLMVTGEKRRFWIPANLAYGDTPSRPGAPVGALTFDVELLKIVDLPEPPKAPEDVAAAPANAKKTASGLAYRVLKKGSGKEHPKATDQVEVHYSGWTTDGKLFDSSVTRGRPATFFLNRVIKGWTEGTSVEALELARRCEADGVARVVYTDIGRDGTRTGVNVEETARVARAVKIPIIASGGVATLEDIRRLRSVSKEGVEGVIVGRALYSGSFRLAEAVKAARESDS